MKIAITAAMIAIGAIGLAPVAHADACDAANQRIAEHNEASGSVDTSDPAAVDAYNLEADRLDTWAASVCSG